MSRTDPDATPRPKIAEPRTHETSPPGDDAEGIGDGPTEVTTAADAIVAALLTNGVRVVFALPGEENLPLVSAMRRAHLPIVVCRHEQHAGFMAVTNARLTGTTAVCLATLGPGALNLFTPLAQAQLMGIPVLALTGQKPLIDNDEGSFQVLDVVGSARPLVTSAISLADPERAAVTVVDALRRTTAPTAGAVVLELPEDVAAAEVSSATSPPLRTMAPVADRAALDIAADRIRRATTPVVLAGRGAVDGKTPEALRRLAERTGLSVLSTQMGKGAIPEIHPRSLRSLGIHRPDHAHLALDEADLVIAIGYRPSEHPPLAWQQDRDLPILHVDAEPARREAGYEPELEVIGDPGDLVERLADTDLAVDTTWSDRIRATVEQALADEHGPSDQLDPLDLVRVLADRQRSGDVVALDNGAYKIWFARHYPAIEPTSLLLDNATATMGAGLAAATEAARLGHRATAVVGDGGLLINVGDLETAVRLGVDLIVLVVRDDGYGFIAWHQDEQDRERHGVELGNPDLVTLARSFGARGRRANTIEELGAAIDEARAASGVSIIDCPIDYAINDML